MEDPFLKQPWLTLESAWTVEAEEEVEEEAGR